MTRAEKISFLLWRHSGFVRRLIRQHVSFPGGCPSASRQAIDNNLPPDPAYSALRLAQTAHTINQYNRGEEWARFVVGLADLNSREVVIS